MIRIIEPVVYLYPHKEELLHSHAASKAMWRSCIKMLKDKDSYLSPILIDDLKREGYIRFQSLDEILERTVNKKFSDLPWFGEMVLESSIKYQYGNLGCKLFDALYHKDIICSLFIMGQEWEWVVIHPEIFKKQQSGMILNLWKMFSDKIKFESIGNKSQIKVEDVRIRTRTEFLNRFTHYWIDNNGNISEITKPIYSKKQIIHEAI
jgi:hypothetical protein